MKLKAPAFWYEKQHLFSNLLTPLSFLYEWGQKKHSRNQETFRASIPIICVGNLTVGGSGKTPCVQSLLELIKDCQIAKNPCILSRGYGGTKNNHFVSEEDTYHDVGDEPFLLSGIAPVMVAQNRAEGAKLIAEKGHDMIIMDDGYQNQQLYKDLSFLVVDGKVGFGNQKLLPAGPMRETLESGLERASALIIINEDSYGIRSLLPSSLPVFEAVIEPDRKNIRTEERYIGFCGIAHPQKFQRTIEAMSIDLVELIDYPDHYNYSRQDITTLLNKAKNQDARLVTTEKDYVRLLQYPELLSLLDTVPIKLKWQEENNVKAFLKERLTS